MTKHEYYDLLVATSLAGGFPAGFIDSGNRARCRYRTAAGKKCAVGLLIPDGKYQPHLEEKSPYSLSSEGVVTPPDGMDANSLEAVQREHDVSAQLSLTGNQPWNHAVFVAALDALPCFADRAPAAATQDPAPCNTP